MEGLGPIRSALFVPGNRPERFEKALATRADVVIIDLEDAVPPDGKTAARRAAAEKLASAAGRRVLVRVNAMDTPHFDEDLAAVLKPGLSGLLVPKIEDERSIPDLDARMRPIEARRGLAAVPVVGLIESTGAVAAVHRILRAPSALPRLHTLAFGAADFTFDLGVAITRDGQELAYPRARLAVACRAAGLPGPLDTPFMLDLKDLDALEADALRAKQLGFGGKLCIHPNQVEIVNRVFSPLPEEIRQAEAVVRAFEEARAKGSGAIQLDGKFIDKPVVERARRVLLMARMLGAGA